MTMSFCWPSREFSCRQLVDDHRTVNMKLRFRVMLLLTILFAVLGIAQLIVQQRILLPGFADLDRQAARKDMDRVANAMQRELELLVLAARDWGDWDVIYEFMQNPNESPVSEYLQDNSITPFRLNVLAFIAPDGRYVWSLGRELKTPKVIDIDILSHGAFPENHPWRAKVREGLRAQGLLRTDRGMMMAVLSPILDGKGHGPSRGMVLVGRLLTDEELRLIGDQAQVRVARIPPPFPKAADGAPVETVTEHDTVNDVTRVFNAVDGSPALMLRIEVPRTISERGHQIVGYAAVFLVLAGGMVLLLMITLLNRSVLDPLSRMTRHAVALGRSDDLTARLELSRTDELGDLAREFDRMVTRLADARRQLVDRSFDAGVAENASGVLHNLGNAMTPLGVEVAALQEKLRDAPTADIELVLAELASAPSATERKSELEAYLRQTSRELAETVASAQADLDTIARNTHSIQAVLSEQAACSRSERVYEIVLLPELIEQSASLVPPQSRQKLSIDLDASLRELGSVRVPRTTLQQVFQNFILNAAEAVRDAGREHGTLRIGASVLDDPRGKRLHMTFADDGVGICDPNLRRIFEKGFSTKSRATNSGIGLHWCANTIGALGGEISAESPGPLGGAILHLILPLLPADDSPLTQAA
jgi:two-component system, NtrC family, sensor kinase